MKSLSIVFDNDGAYYPGDTVTGKVVFTNSKPVKARSITLNWEGINESHAEIFSFSTYKKSIFSHDSILWAPKSGEELITAGTHEYPFSYKLPADCPPSLQFYDVKNQYKATVVVDRPWKKNLMEEAEFVVTKKLDVQGPNTKTYTQTFNKTGLFVNNGPITLSITLPTVVQPGQTIDLTYKIINNSSATVDLLKARLTKNAHYHAREQHTPCQTYYSCPLSKGQRVFWATQLGKSDSAQVDIAPYTESTYQMPFKISEMATTPNFATGLMTFAYEIEVGFEVKGSAAFWTSFYVSMSIGEEKEEKKTPPKSLDSGAPPAYSA
ncbi:hypothetical protein CAEBREN_28229 [Caenorhabditis brenneri]|uniref:Arrestin C-terminal-like domain-containing protein n=1 Tax=Caenorhabditis brenneri TaxID=135651 RepID=G0MN46_CAEBE|nr:hypothetical protein CAEBREN_28229 [Caenorhabditis brenneri]